MQVGRRWWCVKFDASGSVESVHAVTAESKSTPTVIYVLARSGDRAAVAAYRMRQRLAMRARRAEYKAQGLCQCGRKRGDKSFARCETCRTRHHADRRRAQARARGERVKTPPKREAFRQRRAEDAAAIQLETLQWVMEIWQDCSTNGEFTRRLKAMIAKAQGKAAA